MFFCLQVSRNLEEKECVKGRKDEPVDIEGNLLLQKKKDLMKMAALKI